MRTPSFITALLFLGAAAFAQQPKNTPAAELSQLRQNYIHSLKDLLQQYIDKSQFAGAAAVCQELDRTTAPTRKASANRSPVGLWQWADGESTTTFTSDGMTSHFEYAGVWHWIGGSRQKLQIHWKDSTVDTLTLSPDGKTLNAVNNRGEEFVAHRLSSNKEEETGAKAGG